MQVDDTYYFADDRFAAKKRSELKKAGLKAKDKTKLTYTTDIKFNSSLEILGIVAKCLIKLGTTKEKRLMIDVIALRQSYERKKIVEIR
ncbi:polyprotein [Drepanopeziza brunnea f. sp. 'multigermtubi' MB_m1]|uniref:Polyprotein n=1 Tax=Marssonina brunnea f. sp. multigermtubi (strain MB_m1) TaxID=1072389 RepID=K1WWM1_MARBU|nr:polyprotein [Drepanopeziza brunnea f. sp. 'multigermtubi' MB_m1]EKD16917.1 polyprotein [Drepanopeziza brunnea f. sp. 'multigermtubi' MB_m1]